MAEKSIQRERRKPRPDLVERNRTHGLSKIPEYFIWKCMRSRCLRPTDKNFPNYGGRGITVALEWASFAVFLQDVGRRPGPAFSLDRVNNDGPYSPGNVRWATRKEQNNNRRKRRSYPPRNEKGVFTCLS